MQIDFQLIVIALIFAAALFFIGRRLYMQFFKKKTAGCADCAMNEPTDPTANILK